MDFLFMLPKLCIFCVDRDIEWEKDNLQISLVGIQQFYIWQAQGGESGQYTWQIFDFWAKEYVLLHIRFQTKIFEGKMEVSEKVSLLTNFWANKYVWFHIRFPRL